MQDPVTTWDSKVDNFDKRRQLLHAQKDNDAGVTITMEEIESVSFYEFFWKNYVSWGKWCEALFLAISSKVAQRAVSGVALPIYGKSHLNLHNFYT